jgi:hypothetical protein
VDSAKQGLAGEERANPSLSEKHDKTTKLGIPPTRWLPTV